MYSQCGNYRNFSVTHILREINIYESTRSKIAVLVILWALNSVDLVNISLPKVQKFHENQNS